LRRTRIAAVVLAAGTSSRMGDRHKLLEPLAGHPVLHHVIECVVKSKLDPIVVVVGHRADEVRGVASERDEVTVVDNSAYAKGLSTSLQAGVRALPDDVDGMVVFLGDMPLVTSRDVAALVDAFHAGSVCVPRVEGRRGNPVLWSKIFFGRILELGGDRGARSILESAETQVIEVALDNRGLLLDVDTPEDLERIRRFE